jgi:hypothetical protein
MGHRAYLGDRNALRRVGVYPLRTYTSLLAMVGD